MRISTWLPYVYVIWWCCINISYQNKLASILFYVGGFIFLIKLSDVKLKEESVS